MSDTFDAIVIGAGHNGLTAAAYLAKGGAKTLVVERRDVVGGAAVTEEFHPGYRNSIASYVVSLLRSEIIRDLELKRHGLEFIEFDGYLHLCGDEHVWLSGDEARDRAEIARFSNRDYDAMQQFHAMLTEVGDVVRDHYLRPPLDIGGGFHDLLGALRAGRRIRRLPARRRHQLFKLFTGSAGDMIERHFESDMVRAMYASECMSGNFASFYQAGSAIPFFHHDLGELEGVRGKWGTARGGMGAITQAMAASAREAGAQIRTGAPVERILVDEKRAAGVRLVDGTELHAGVVLANTDPQRTFLKLLGREHLDEDFADDIAALRMGHASLRINLALRALPGFALADAYPGQAFQHSKIFIFPSMAEMEQNYHDARAGLLPEKPRLDILIPSSRDDSLTAPGQHVMSVLCKYYPYELADGANWDTVRDQVADEIIAGMARYFPDLPGLIAGRQVLSPLDLERVFGLTRGDIFHGRHELDQIFSQRPHPASAQYRTPLPGLYLCGSGAHPGGAVSGAPGYNCAKRVLRDLRRRSATYSHRDGAG